MEKRVGFINSTQNTFIPLSLEPQRQVTKVILFWGEKYFLTQHTDNTKIYL